jgi:hypothetical protein
MNEQTKDGKEEVNPIKFVGMMIPLLPSLLVRLTAIFIRFKGEANKAGKIFKQELIQQGIDHDTASELTGIYLESSHIRKYIQGFTSE